LTPHLIDNAWHASHIRRSGRRSRCGIGGRLRREVLVADGPFVAHSARVLVEGHKPGPSPFVS